MSRHRYVIYDQLSSGEQIPLGENAFVQDEKQGVTQSQFRYLAEYLCKDDARSIDPVNLPLSDQIFDFNKFPGALDDVLPDRWGREVALKLGNIKRHDTAGLIEWLSSHHIGSLSFVKHETNAPPHSLSKRTIGHPMDWLEQLERESRKFENNAIPDVAKEWALTLANGASVGGARRKTLVEHEGNGYLVKFPQKNDPINMPRIEHASMTLAQKVGIKVAETRLTQVNGKDVLLVKRFDIDNGYPCRQLLSFDTLLQGHAYHYGELAKVLIEQVTTSRLEESLLQLFMQMCFNICINNTDDHLKNFSLLRDEKGWVVSPAYDLVPSTTLGEYHQLGFEYSNVPPKGEALLMFAKKHFHLRESQAVAVITACEREFNDWQLHFALMGVDKVDVNYLKSIIAPRLGI